MAAAGRVVGQIEHDLGQAKTRGRLVDHDAVAAGERELHAASETESAHECKRWIGRRLELIEGIPASPDERNGLVDVLQLPEFVDVGAGDETIRLAGADHQSFRRVRSEITQHRAKFLQDGGGQGVGGGIGFVQGEPGDAVDGALGFPMVEGLHAFFRFRRARPASRRPDRRRCKSRQSRAWLACA